MWLWKFDKYSWIKIRKYWFKILTYQSQAHRCLQPQSHIVASTKFICYTGTKQGWQRLECCSEVAIWCPIELVVESIRFNLLSDGLCARYLLTAPELAGLGQGDALLQRWLDSFDCGSRELWPRSMLKVTAKLTRHLLLLGPRHVLMPGQLGRSIQLDHRFGSSEHYRLEQNYSQLIDFNLLPKHWLGWR